MRSLVEILVSHEKKSKTVLSAQPSKMPLFCPWEENFGLQLIYDSGAILKTKMEEVASVKSWNQFPYCLQKFFPSILFSSEKY